MAFTTTQLSTLENAIATGSLSVEFDGKRVQYRSLDEMMRIRGLMRTALGLATSSRFSLTAFTKDSGAPAIPSSFDTNIE